MKELKDFRKDIEKCSRCGLCQTVCPVYKLTKNDCAVSKGKFIMLNGVVKGDLKLSKKINQYLDLCLKCGKCKNFCPSDIDACHILSSAKHDYIKTQTIMHNIINILFSRVIFNNVIKIFNTISKPFRPDLKHNQKGEKVLYFKGCVNQIMPQTDKYLTKIFKNTDINIITPDFECCGLPFLSEGAIERFEQCAQYNYDKIKNECEYLVTDCSSCENTLRNYPKYIDCEINNKKFVNWGELIAKYNIKFEFEKPMKVTFHKPCHMHNDDFVEKIFSNCKNTTYIKMAEYDECCGFAGSFGIKNHKISKEISIQKAKNIEQTNADIVITTCPSCIMGLKQGLYFNKTKNVKVMTLLEFLSKAEKIIP